jgi:hypothetical protein
LLSIVGVGGLYSPDDGFRHAIVGTTDGNMHEIYYSPNVGIFHDVLANFGPNRIVAVGAFYSPDDGARHALVATDDVDSGPTPYDISFDPGFGIHVLAHISGTVGIAGFYTNDDGYRHAIVGTGDGTVYEVFYNQNYSFVSPPGVIGSNFGPSPGEGGHQGPPNAEWLRSVGGERMVPLASGIQTPDGVKVTAQKPSRHRLPLARRVDPFAALDPIPLAARDAFTTTFG